MKKTKSVEISLPPSIFEKRMKYRIAFKKHTKKINNERDELQKELEDLELEHNKLKTEYKNLVMQRANNNLVFEENCERLKRDFFLKKQKGFGDFEFQL
ncbi:hypothetical protein MHBO_002585 [Bonamia ostreae]|uniref:BZIP domain-containing protein n=1 Tax=Bonamia ostreae TaxID=126728 RepID=A0ABV2AN96_9EUKA